MTPPRSAAAVRCSYDWKAGPANVLACTTHREAHSIVRMPSLGHDILLELFARGMLTGEAQREAEKLFGA